MGKVRNHGHERKPDFADWRDKAAALNLKKRGNALIGPCPSCGGNDRFSVTKSAAGGALFFCRHCQPGRDNPQAAKAILKAAGFEIRRDKRRATRPRKPAKPVRRVVPTGDEPAWYAAQLEALRLHVLHGTARRPGVAVWRHRAVKRERGA